MEDKESLSHRIASFIERRSGWFILTIVAITIVLAIPMFALAPDEDASDNPGGPVYDLQDRVDDTFLPRVHDPFFIAEAHNGDILTQEPLWELFQNIEELQEADRNGKLNPPGLLEQPYLFSGFDADPQQPIVGIYTLANAVQELLLTHPNLATKLEHATDGQVKFAVSKVFSDPRTEGF